MTTVPIGFITPAITVDGMPMASATMASLISIEVDRSLNLIGRATLRFVEPAFDLEVQPTLGIGAVVEIDASGGSSLFQGTVTGFSLDQDMAGPAGTTLTVTVDDDGQKLTRKSTHKAYLKQTYSAVLSDVIGGTGLSASVVALNPVEDYILQSGTALSFLDWVCSRFGLQWWVEGRTVTVEKAGTSSATVALELGKTLIRLSTRASDRHPGSVTVTGWDPKQQVQVTHTASTKKSPESDLFSKVSGRGNPPGTVTVPAGALTTAEATAVSGSLLTHATASAVTTRGTAYVTPTLKPGTTVSISGAGPASASYLVSRVQHVYSAQGFETRFVAGPLQTESLVDLLGAPAPNGGALSGTLATAVVTNKKDDAKPGQVKVKLFMHGEGVDSQWARVVTR